MSDPAVRALAKSRVFWAMLVVKLALGASAASFYLRDLFTPFVSYFVESRFADPWAHFASLGRLTSFPYPPVMLYAMAVPRWLFAAVLPAGTDVVTARHLLVMRLPLLAADLAIALVLLRWFPHRRERVLWFYWCSPFVVYIGYWHGQLDLIPTALFVVALALLRARSPAVAFVVLGLALAAKSHLLVAVPFVLVYVWQDQGMLRTARWAAVMTVTYLLAVGPFLPDPAFRRIVYATEEQNRLFAFRLSVDAAGPAILLAPTAITILWLRFAAYAKRNWDLLMLYLGLVFSVFVLLAPPRPGYFVWSLPFVIHFVCRSRASNGLLYAAYGAAYLLFFWLGRESDLFDAWRIVAPAVAAWPTPHAWLAVRDPVLADTVDNVLFSAMEGALACIIGTMYWLGVRSNEVYRRRTTPALVGVAGDSASGKRTFAGLVARALGEARVTVISGDDYHRWPRGHEMYQVYTHLHVSANDLHRQRDDALALSRGKSVVKGTYDHATGTFTEDRLLDPGEYVVFTGLHALAIAEQRALYDLRVFLDPDEGLRRRWKVRRDARERGYDEAAVLRAMDEREKDRQAYVVPQREHAEVVVRWCPADGARGDAVALAVDAQNGFDLAPLVAALRAVESLTVEHDPYIDARWQRVRIAGDVSAERIREIGEAVVPNVREVTVAPRFEEGVRGCLQLVFLVCLSAKLR